MRELQEILKRYGQWALLKHGDEEKKIRVFFQPERSREEDIPGAVTSIGWVDSRLWNCIGTEPVEPGDVLVLDGHGLPGAEQPGLPAGKRGASLVGFAGTGTEAAT